MIDTRRFSVAYETVPAFAPEVFAYDLRHVSIDRYACGVWVAHLIGHGCANIFHATQFPVSVVPVLTIANVFTLGIRASCHFMAVVSSRDALVDVGAEGLPVSGVSWFAGAHEVSGNV